MSVNPVCGRKKCKYKVPHEHVQFLAPGIEVRDENSYKLAPSPVESGEIEKALRALPCQDDPSADRFQEPPVGAQIKVLQESVARLREGIAESGGICHNQLKDLIEGIETLLGRRNSTSFAKIVLGTMTGGLCLLCSTIILIGAGIKVATLLWG